MTNYDKIAYDFFRNSFLMNDYLRKSKFSKEELEEMKLELFSQNDERVFYLIKLNKDVICFSGMIVVEKDTGEVYNPYLPLDKKHFDSFLDLQEEMILAKDEEEKAKELLDYGRW